MNFAPPCFTIKSRKAPLIFKSASFDPAIDIMPPRSESITYDGQLFGLKPTHAKSQLHSCYGEDLNELRYRQEIASYVYIKDEAYSWLPAKVLSIDRAANTARVQIMKPTQWSNNTVFSSPTKRVAVGAKRLGARSSLESSLMFSSVSSTYKDVREVKLSDYPNQELPLQNREITRFTNTADESDSGEEEPCPSSTKGSVLPLMTVKANMADLPFLHEASVLYNVKELYCRPIDKKIPAHEQCVPYTRVGDIVIALNPFRWMEHLYSDKMQRLYADRLVWSTSSNNNVDSLSATSTFLKAGYQPHVYETSSLAYRALCEERINQTILVSGESGAGKTETVKIVMSHLAKVQSMKVENNNNKFQIVERILESNPLFEAFGNAKTTRNDNSSRFGKFTSLIFQLAETNGEEDHLSHGVLVGSTTETYLLEKSRVVAHGAQERTYHIFYQLLAASDSIKSQIWPEGLANTTFESFNYVGHADTHATEDCHRADGEAFEKTLNVLKLFDIVGDKLTEFLRALCIVMQLGNITFGPLDDHDKESSVVTSREELEKLSHLMGVPSNSIESALTKRAMEARGETFAVSLTPAIAKDGCDALAKELYARLFDFLVQIINRASQVDVAHDSSYSSVCIRPQMASIGILDLFGFESFEVNRFEQLCINYANEKLQQKYVMDNFQRVKDEYISEGIDLFDLSKVDNTDVLELFEGRRDGLITILNDESIRPNGSAASYVYKIKSIYKDNKLLVKQGLHRPEEFGIKHFIGCITYDASNFVERNTDAIPCDLVQCVIRSTNSIVRHQFTEWLKEKSVAASPQGNQKSTVLGRRRATAAASKTVAAKFRMQLNELVTKINDSRTRYIRCVRPNKDMTPGKVDHISTIRQLASAGLVTAITISRETYPDRLEYSTILSRFAVLLPKREAISTSLCLDEKKQAEELLSVVMHGFGRDVVGRRGKAYALGKTRIYFRTGALEYIESLREQYYAARAVVLQAFVRCKNTRHFYLLSRQKCIILQVHIRALCARQNYLRFRWAILRLQTIQRRNADMVKYYHIKRNYKSTIIQAQYRGYKQRHLLKFWNNCASQIQRFYHRFLQRKHAIIVIQSRYRGCSQRKCVALWNTRASKIQGLMRWYRCRMQASKLIQAGCRRFLQRKCLVMWNASATKIHKVWNFFKKRKWAAIVMQTVYRGRKQRYTLNIWNLATARIQRWYIRKRNKNSFAYDLDRCKNALDTMELQYHVSCLKRRDLMAHYFTRKCRQSFMLPPKKSKKSKRLIKHLKLKLHM